MAQHIGLQREAEDGSVLAEFDADGIPVDVLRLAPQDSTCARFIDPYGDTVFNQLQLPVLIAELSRMIDETTDSAFCTQLRSAIQFLAQSEGVHQYVRFVGD